MTYFFLRISSLMKAYHNYEYERHIGQMNLTYVLVLGVFLFYIFFFSMYMYLQVSLYGWWNMENLYTTMRDACSNPEMKRFGQMIAIMQFISYETCTPTIQCSFVIVIIKRSDDILQGINKLDYLLKVSVFQKYKDPKLERGKFSIFTGDTQGPVAIDLLTSSELNRCLKQDRYSEHRKSEGEGERLKRS